MAYTLGYPSECDDIEVVHTCTDCNTPAEPARLMSVFFMLDDFEFSNPALFSEWEAAILAGNVVVIPKTNGDFDGGTPQFEDGYGEELQQYVTTEFKANYKDRDLKANWAFYEGKKLSKRWRFGFRTKNYVFITNTPCTIVPRFPVENNIKGSVVWNVEVSCAERENP